MVDSLELIFFYNFWFLISTILFKNIDQGIFSFKEFYAKRIIRIFPALITVLVFCLIVGWLTLLSNELSQLGSMIAAGASFIANFVLWSDAGYFDSSINAKPLLHLWMFGG